MSGILGKQSIKFENPPYILATANIVGKKEGEGPLGSLFDIVGEDDLFGEETWEEAESAMQKNAATWAINNAKLTKEQIRYIFAGDLLGQNIATSFGLLDLEIPLFGLFGACSTAGESLSLAAICVSAGYADYALAVTSSHFASAEKQFRYPLEYGNQRPLSACWTVTGSAAFIVSNQKSQIKISGITTGKIVDFGIKDSMNMGAAMAPAACDTIYQNFMDFNFQPTDYDKIVTGDLGYVGSDILIELLKEKGFDISKQHMDCGKEIFEQETQDTHAGGSGCGCSATTLSAYFLKELEKGKLNKILFVPTGALLSTVSFNEGQSVPGIAHAVMIERCNE
jgi:stage V sporulation protein AD